VSFLLALELRVSSLTLIRLKATFDGRIVDGVDHLQVLDSAIASGLWAGSNWGGAIMHDNIQLLDTLKPIVLASVLPTIWRMETRRYPFIM
jgi:hypothetical protein